MLFHLPWIARNKLGFILGSMAVLAGAACGERPTPPASPPAPSLEIATAQPETESSAEPIATRHPGATSFAQSPMTAFANQVIDLIRGVLDGRPPPSGPLPLIPWQSFDRLVKSRASAPTPRHADLEFIVFGIELSVVLSEDAQAPPTSDAGRLETITFLSRSGLKIAKLSVRDASRAHPLPPWLEGAKRFGSDIFDAARHGTLEKLLVGEPERAVLGNDLLFAQVLKDLPDRSELERAQALAKSKRGLIGFRFDDVFVVARDKRGEIWGFKLEIEEEKGQLAFETSPLIEVSRMEPEQLR